MIFWLASYPKSGNTWLRAFLANFLYPEHGPADINQLPLKVNPASDRRVFDQIVGLESSDLSPDEIDAYRSDVCRKMASASAQTLYLKTHDAYLRSHSGEPLIPADVSYGAVYVVRNPLDVAISFAHHLGQTIDETIDRMADPTFTLSGNPTRLHRKLRQRTLSWSAHGESWLEQTAIPVHIMKYEDMLTKPIETFTASIRFLGLECDDARIRQAVEWSSFDRLRGQESRFGFKERPPGVSVFFRSGVAGQWRSRLGADQVKRITDDHRKAMVRFGYWESPAQER